MLKRFILFIALSASSFAATNDIIRKSVTPSYSRGPLHSFVVRSNVIYGAQEAGSLGIWSVSGTNFTHRGYINTGGGAWGIDVVGNYAFMADQGLGLQIIDCSNIDAPVKVGRYNTSGQSQDVLVTNDVAFVADNYGGLQIISVTNKASPSLLGTYDSPGLGYGVDVYGQYAFLADYLNGIQVISITNLAVPTLVTNYDTPGRALRVKAVGNFLYVSDWDSGMQILSITNPAAPTLVGSYNTSGDAEAIDVVGNTAYIADFTGGLVAVDVSTPSSPALKSVLTTGGYGYDISIDPLNSNRAYLSDHYPSIRYVDISQPTNMVIVGGFNDAATARRLVIRGNTAFVSTVGDIEVWDVSNRTTPTLLSKSTTRRSTSLDYDGAGVLAVADEFDGLVTFGVTNLSSPVRLGSLALGAIPEEVVLSNNLAYVSKAASGVQILSITNPASPVSIGSYNTAGSASGMCLVGTNLYVADGTSGLVVLDVSNPGTPELVGSVSLGGLDATDVKVLGNLAYMAVGDNGVSVVSVTNPSSPVLLSTYNTAGTSYGVFPVNQSNIVVADGSKGVIILNASDPFAVIPNGSITNSENAQSSDVAVSGTLVGSAAYQMNLDLLEVAGFASSSSPSPGDTISAAVLPKGWQLSWTLAGMTNGGTYAFGLGSSNTLTEPKVVITYTAQGYDGNGDLTTVTVTNYVGARSRAVVITGSGDPNVADETLSGTNLTINLSLADYIPSGASNISVSIAAGVYTASGITNSATTIIASNLSAQPYWKAIANWVTPPAQDHNTSSASLELVAFHRSAQDERPIRCVRIIGTDQHSNTVSGVFSNWSVSTGDALPFGRIACSIPITGLTQGDLVRWDFVAYPWVGDTNSVFDTRQNTYTGITPLPSSITNLVNHTGEFLGSYALVRTNGNNSTGKALSATQYALSPGSLTNAFATIEGALEAIAGTNNMLNSHNDVDVSYVLLDQGHHAYTGGTITGGALTTTKSWLTITTNIGASTDQTFVDSGSGTKDFNKRVRMKGISLGGSANVFSGGGYLLWEDCDVTESATQYVIAPTDALVWYILRGTIRDCAQGIRYAAGYSTSPVLRGVTFDGFSGNIHVYTMVGCLITNSPNAIIRFDFPSQPTPAPDYQICYNVAKYGDSTLSSSFQGPKDYTIQNGYFIGNVLLESTTNNINNLAWDFGADNAIHLTNALIWHVTDVGRKNFVGYNDTGTNAAYRIGWQWVNNYSDDYNNKSYDHGSTEPNANTNRIGAEALKHGVGYSGSILSELANIGASSSFLPIVFSGIKTWYPSTTTDTNFAKFVRRGAFDGGASSGIGGGDYRPNTNSPLVGMPWRRVLPYDIGGNQRAAVDAAGAWTSGLTSSGVTDGTIVLKVRITGNAIIVKSVTIQ